MVYSWPNVSLYLFITMAKQIGVVQFRGKLGNVVGAKKAKGQQGATLRAKAANVSNPKTTAQKQQRIKMLPAVNFYRQLAEILDHAFQGVEYGGPSHNYFMKQALLAAPGSFPYLVKDDTRPIPGEYLVAKGGLVPVKVDALGDENIAFTLIVAAGSNISTLGALSQALLNGQSNLNEGDQITFIFGRSSSDNPAEEDSTYWFDFFRIVLNTADETPIEDIVPSGYSIGILNERLAIDAEDGAFFTAAACIVSRPPRTAGGSWQRSTTTLFVSEGIKAQFMSNAALNAAMDSYGIKESEISSDWYLNGGTSNSGGTTVRQVTISLEKTPQNGGTVEGAGTYEQGTQVYVTATPATNYRFSGWYEDENQVSTAATYGFTANFSRTLRAEFAIDEEP